MRRNSRQFLLILFVFTLLSFVSTGKCEDTSRPPIYITLIDIPPDLAPFNDLFAEEVGRFFGDIEITATVGFVSSTAEVNTVGYREVLIFMKDEGPPFMLGVTQHNSPYRVCVVFWKTVLKGMGISGEFRSLEPRAKKLVVTTMAKVVVHESIHAILPRLGHTGNGLMSKSTSQESLVVPYISVEKVVRKWLVVELEMEERFKDND